MAVKFFDIQKDIIIVENEIVTNRDVVNDTSKKLLRFSPIGIGKPLSIEIETVYTGDVPGRKSKKNKASILVTSALKSTYTFDAAQRAINFVRDKVGDKQYVERSAVHVGTPLIYYSAAVDANLTCTLEITADNYKEEVLNSIKEGFSFTGSMPLFVSKGYFVAGKFLLNIAGKIIKSLTETDSFLRDSIDINFTEKGDLITNEGVHAIINNTDEGEFNSFRPSLDVNSGGSKWVMGRKNADGTLESYSGNAPYILIKIDGTEKDLDFTPQLANAAMLNRFFGTKHNKNTSQEALQVSKDAIQLYNDFSFRKKAEKKLKELEGLDKSSDEFLEKSSLLEAYKSNIGNDVLKMGLDLID